MNNPNLDVRGHPKQARGRKTVESILNATAELLDEVGVERVSTNMICDRAGLAPASLYRFFPNKYAILKELAERLMETQNAALLQTQLDPDDLAVGVEQVLRSQFDVTLATSAGPIIMRSLHAIPELRNIRLSSHERAVEAILPGYQMQLPNVPKQELRRRVRLIIEIGYASLEYAFDAPKTARNQILRDAAHLLTLYHQDLLGIQNAK